MNIFVIRHTEYDNPQNIYPGRLPLTLSVKGRRHAQRIGEWFKNQKFIQLPIYSSPVARTLETAQIIASYIDAPIQIVNNLTEVLYGWQGKPIKEKLGGPEFYHQPQIESFDSILKRIQEILNEKIKQGKDCILITHGEHVTRLYHYLKNEQAPDPWLDKEYVRLGEIIWLKYEKKQLKIISRINV